MKLKSPSQSRGPPVFFLRPFLVKLHSYIRYPVFGVSEGKLDQILISYVPLSGSVTRGHTAPSSAKIAFQATTGFPIISDVAQASPEPLC